MKRIALRLIAACMILAWAGGCSKDEGSSVTPGPASTAVTDIDGNIYRTVKIGAQEWMVENLKTTRYNDGTPIAAVTDPDTWSSLSTPAYSWYNNDATTYKEPYGALYNWYAVRTGKLAPKGWHVPSDAEWHALMAALDNNAKVNAITESETAGGTLKEPDTTHWKKPNTGATNSSGFRALPGGFRNEYGFCMMIREIADFWTASDDGDATYAWTRFVSYDSPQAFKYYTWKVRGLSVRCVKD